MTRVVLSISHALLPRAADVPFLVADASRSAGNTKRIDSPNLCAHTYLDPAHFVFRIMQKSCKPKASRQERSKAGIQDRAASFALASEDGIDMPAGLELVLRVGRRLRISQGVQEETLRAVLAAMESGK